MKKLISRIKNPKTLKIVITFIVLILVLGGFYLYEKMNERVFIDNSLATAPVVSVSTINAGKLTEIDVYEGKKIKKADPIAVVNGQTLYADTDGLVIMANNQIGSIVNSQSPVAQIINLNDMRIAGTIDENKGLDQIKVGQVVSFTVDALPGKNYWGYVDEVSPTAKQTQLSFSISSERPTQQFIVYARFDANKYPEIKNGMSARMIVYTKTY